MYTRQKWRVIRRKRTYIDTFDELERILGEWTQANSGGPHSARWSQELFAPIYQIFRNFTTLIRY